MPVRVQTFLLALFILLAAMCVYASESIGTVVFAALAVCMLFFVETQFDLQRAQVTRIARVLGILPVFRREQSMGEFAAIHCYNIPSTDNMLETWVVSLRPRGGRAIVVRNFTGSIRAGQAGADAEEFAHELSNLTHLEVVDHAA